MISRIGVILSVAVVVVAIVAGCGGGSTTGPGSAIIGPNGGQLIAGGIIVIVPPGALPTEFTLVVAPLSAAQVLAPPGGLTVMSAAQFEPEGLAFALPVTITFPLSARLPGGQTLPLWWIQGGAWSDSGFHAVVSADGRTAVADVTHFSIYAIFADYAPLKTGASWTYNRTVQTTPAGGAPNPPDVSTVTATITGTEDIGGLTSFIWSESAPSNLKLWLHRSNTELLLVAVEPSGQPQQVLSPPARVLMLPPDPGQTWQVALPMLAATAQALVTAETITVGAGSFDAMRVCFTPSPPAQGEMNIWFAPQVGPVKWLLSSVEPGVQTTVTEMDLMSYSIP
jgi:hypothetical protein